MTYKLHRPQFEHTTLNIKTQRVTMKA